MAAVCDGVTTLEEATKCVEAAMRALETASGRCSRASCGGWPSCVLRWRLMVVELNRKVSRCRAILIATLGPASAAKR